MNETLDLSSSSSILAGLQPGFGPKPGFTRQFVESIPLDGPEGLSLKEIEMHIRAIDMSILCPLTLADAAWRYLVQVSGSFESSKDKRYLAYRRADTCLRTVFFRFPEYFEPEDLDVAARMLAVDLMMGPVTIDSDASSFAKTFIRYANAGQMDPLKNMTYWSVEMQAMRQQGFATRFVQVFRQLLCADAHLAG